MDGERAPLLQSLSETNRRKPEEGSYTFTERSDGRSIRFNEYATNRRRRFNLSNRSWYTTTLVTALLATVAAVAAVVGILSVSLSSELGVGKSVVGDGRASIDEQPASSNTQVPVEPQQHSIEFKRHESHGVEDSSSNGDWATGTTGSPRGGQSPLTSGQDATDGRHRDGSKRARLGPVSQSSPTVEGQHLQAGGTGDTIINSIKPNIFVFLIDDMGWNDIGYQSTDLFAYSPHLDAMAADGVKVRYTPRELRYCMCFLSSGAGPQAIRAIPDGLDEPVSPAR